MKNEVAKTLFQNNYNSKEQPHNIIPKKEKEKLTKRNSFPPKKLNIQIFPTKSDFLLFLILFPNAYFSQQQSH